MLGEKATNSNFIVIGLTDTGLNIRSTTLEASMLTITPPMRFMIGERNVLFIVIGDHFDPSDIYIHVAIIIYIK